MKSSLTVSSIVGIERQGSFKEGEVFGAGLNPFTLFVGVITYTPDKIITTIERTEIGLLSLDAFGQASSSSGTLLHSNKLSIGIIPDFIRFKLGVRSSNWRGAT